MWNRLRIGAVSARHVKRVLYYLDKDSGAWPYNRLTLGSDGTLYGTTDEYGSGGYGTAFALRPSGSQYLLTVLHAFADGNDGAWPTSPLIVDAGGAVYGAAGGGGSDGCLSNGCGVIYKLTHTGSTYAETILHAFLGTYGGNRDGEGPGGTFVLTASGELFGVTAAGGSPCENDGTVYKLTPSRGSYFESILERFPGCKKPRGMPNGLSADATGALYVSSFSGGRGGCPNSRSGCGAAIKLTPVRSGYRATHIYDFRPDRTGQGPTGGFVVAADGTLYGSTNLGGYGGKGCRYSSTFPSRGCGVLFKLVPTPSGYVYTAIFRFNHRDGDDPSALTADATGALYGTTIVGGRFGYGTVFKFTP